VAEAKAPLGTAETQVVTVTEIPFTVPTTVSTSPIEEIDVIT
jgi:hypothetical protein